jgi:hypothetical protein
MFIAAPSEASQNIVATRLTDPTRHKPSQFSLASPEIYTNFAKSEKSDCGPGMMNMYVRRLLDTEGKTANNISQTLKVGEPIDFIYAGLEKVDAEDIYSNTPGHYAGNGFYGRMQLKIETTGYVNQLNVFDLYVVHGIVFAVCWGLLALL